MMSTAARPTARADSAPGESRTILGAMARGGDKKPLAAADAGYFEQLRQRKCVVTDGLPDLASFAGLLDLPHRTRRRPSREPGLTSPGQS